MGLWEGYREGADRGTHLTVAQLVRIFLFLAPRNRPVRQLPLSVCRSPCDYDLAVPRSLSSTVVLCDSAFPLMLQQIHMHAQGRPVGTEPPLPFPILLQSCAVCWLQSQNLCLSSYWMSHERAVHSEFRSLRLFFFRVTAKPQVSPHHSSRRQL